MSFCSNCGTQVEGNVCPNCGTPVQQQPPQQPYQQQPYQQQPYQQQPYQQQPYQQQPYQQQPYQQQPYQQPQQQSYQSKPGQGFAIAALILAIIGVLCSFSFMYSLITITSDGSDLSSKLDAAETLDDMVIIGRGADIDANMGFSINAIFWGIFGFLAVAFVKSAWKKGYDGGLNKAGNIMGYATIAMTVISVIISFIEFS